MIHESSQIFFSLFFVYGDQVDKLIYQRIPDSMVSLTEKGKKQAEEVGQKLATLIGNETVRFFGTLIHKICKTLITDIDQKKHFLTSEHPKSLILVSPYLRSRQTLECILNGANLSEAKYSVREEPRLREQGFSINKKNCPKQKIKVKMHAHNICRLG